MAPDDFAPLLRAGKKRPLWAAGGATHAVDYRRPDIERLLPHRDPFLFVDQITSIDIEQATIAGKRRIDPADPVFAGHFPGAPIYPGVLLLETMGQLGICLSHFIRQSSHEISPGASPADVRALKIHNAIFLAEVCPRDELTILGKLVHDDDSTAVCAGQIMKGETIAAFAVMEVYFVES